MKNIAQFNLIQGDFNAENAKDLLANLYSSKIKYHSICALRHEEKFAEKSKFHSKRIHELKSERDLVLKFLSTLNTSTCLKIESSIQLSVSE
jgi:uncharacterized membrane protein YgaE (UPF0421/DUF939 family)